MPVGDPGDGRALGRTIVVHTSGIGFRVRLPARTSAAEVDLGRVSGVCRLGVGAAEGTRGRIQVGALQRAPTSDEWVEVVRGGPTSIYPSSLSAARGVNPL